MMIAHSLKALSAPCLVATAIAMSPVAAGAQTFCSEPLEPVCFETLPDAEDDLQVNRCLEDADAFETAVEEYTACVENNLTIWREESAVALTDVRCALAPENAQGCDTEGDSDEDPE